MLKSIIWIICWSLLPVAVHKSIFPDVNIWSVSSLIIFFLSLPVSIFILTQPKAVQVALTLLETFCFCVLLGWHHFYKDELTLFVLISQYSEGAEFAGSTLSVLLARCTTAGLIGLCIIGVVCPALWSLRLPIKKRWGWLALFSVFAIIGISHVRLANPEFNEKEFMWEAKNLGYPLAWIYELNADYNENVLFEAVNRNYLSDKKHPELQSINLPDNIYMIQVESLDYNAVAEAMPFLQSLKQKGVSYQVAPHAKKSSANIDFSMLSLKPVYQYTYGMVYKMLPPEIYDNIRTLPDIMKESGYYTRFFHGVSGHFFNRKSHVEKMGFNEIYFKEDLPQTADMTRLNWRLEDQALFDFAAGLPKKEKNFNFFITVSSHFPFDVKGKDLLFAQPKNIREKYLNSVHYVDAALKRLFETAPQHSLFIIYSDHHSSTSEDERTLFLIYAKQGVRTEQHAADVDELPLMILEILENNKLPVLLKS